jgi:hypothetical protein
VELTAQEGILQAVTNMDIVRMDGNAYVQQDRVLDIISRHTAKVDKSDHIVEGNKMVEPLAELKKLADDNGYRLRMEYADELWALSFIPESIEQEVGPKYTNWHRLENIIDEARKYFSKPRPDTKGKEGV